MRGYILVAVLMSGGLAGAYPYAFTVSCDRTNLVYRCGETAQFTVLAKDLGAETNRGGVVRLTLDNFGSACQLSREVDFAVENPVVVKGSLDEPGFLRLALKGPGSKGDRFSIGKGDCCWSVGFEPEKIRPCVPRPADFADYWRGERARLEREVPLDPQLEELPERPKVNVKRYRVSFATFGGKRVYGFLTVPKKGGTSYPADVFVPGAGAGLCEDAIIGDPACVSLRMNVHPIRPGKTGKEQSAVYTDYCSRLSKELEGPAAYPSRGLHLSREAFFFHDIILGIARSVDWLVQQKFVDDRRIVYRGGSQGGFMGLALAALTQRFAKVYVYVPAVTDTFAREVRGLQNPWPSALEVYAARMKDALPSVRANLPYFDAVNFASEVRCPIRVAVGLADLTCPPPGVWAAYNALPSKDKRMYQMPGMPHAAPGGAVGKEINAWLSFPGEVK